MRRRGQTVVTPSDSTMARIVALSLILFAWGLSEFLRSL